MVSYIGKDLGKSGNLKINGYLVFRNYTYSVQTHGAPYCGYGYVPLRLGWGGGGSETILILFRRTAPHTAAMDTFP